MQIAILTSAPDIIDTYLSNTILRQAMLNEAVLIHIIDIRNHAKGNYRQIDDTPFGGGSGMILMAEPLMKAIESAFIAPSVIAGAVFFLDGSYLNKITLIINLLKK